MYFNELSEDNYMMFAIRHYNNPYCVTKEEFFEDMKKFRHIKKLFNKYKKTGVLRTHLLLNHIITVYNLFDDAATPLLFYKMGSEHWPALKTFLLFLNRLPENTKSLDSIPIDQYCFKELKLI